MDRSCLGTLLGTENYLVPKRHSPQRTQRNTEVVKGRLRQDQALVAD